MVTEPLVDVMAVRAVARARLSARPGPPARSGAAAVAPGVRRGEAAPPREFAAVRVNADDALVMQQSSCPHSFLTHEPHADSDHQVLPFPTRLAACVPTELPAQSAGRHATRPRARVSTRAIRQAMALAVTGRLSEVVEDLDRAIQLALADGPRGVVCDLSAVLGDMEPVAVEVLATAGRHVRDWPGIPVGVACPDPQVRAALRAHPLGRHLFVTESLFSALSAVLATPTLTVASRRLAAHPTAPRASRGFVAHTLLDLQLAGVVPLASQVVSELVASSTIDAGTDIDLSLVWNLGALRLTVRDHGPGLPGQSHSGFNLGRGLTAVAGLARAFGVLPTADGGKVVWAVLDAPRRPPLTSRHRPADRRQVSRLLNDAMALTEQRSSATIERSHR
jgi:hypothetical protein